MAFTMTVAELIEADTSGLLGKHSTWERVSLADVAHILNGAPFDSSLFSLTEGMPLVRIRDVVAGETKTFYSGPYEDDFLVKSNDLLVGMDGDFHSGYWGAKTALLNQRVCKISPAESFYDKRLLALALPGYLMAINANTPSVTVKHLSSKTIGEIGLPLPPRKEQTRIVDKLEEILTGLEAGVAELKTAQKKLAQYRQSFLKAAVEGALTPEWRATNKPTETGAQLLERILQERRARWEAKQLAKFKEQDKVPPKDWQKKYPEPVQPDTTDLPELPRGWVWASLDQVVHESLLGLDRSQSFQSKTCGNVSYLKMNNLSMNGEIQLDNLVKIDASAEEIERYQLSVDDILFNTRNSKELVGKVGRVTKHSSPIVFNNNLMRLRFDGAVTPSFICFQMISPEFRSRMELIKKATTSVAAVYAKDLFPMAIAMPPFFEQVEISRLLENVLAEIVAIELAIEYQFKKAIAQRQNVLKAAFSGQLVPQDPSDEPASELLARIRAERAAQQAIKKPRGRKAKEAA